MSEKKILIKKKKVRIPFVDTLRGTMLVSMILYHASWNLVYLYDFNWVWYRNSIGAYVWQQSICCTFIFLSGFCFSMGKRKLRNGALIFASGILVSLVTGIVMPENMVRFGVLTCIGSCILLTAFVESIFRRLPAAQSAVVSMLLFLFTRQINRGYLGIGSRVLLDLPSEWYSSLYTAYLGMPPQDFVSTDYFSLIPWLFLFWTGLFVYRAVRNTGFLQMGIMRLNLPVLGLLGRHSLFVYMIHQPVLYLLCEILYQ